MKYVQPRSLTWWSGICLILTGASLMVMPGSFALTEFGRLLAMFAGSGDASPATLVFIGTGLIGIRARLQESMGGGA